MLCRFRLAWGPSALSAPLQSVMVIPRSSCKTLNVASVREKGTPGFQGKERRGERTWQVFLRWSPRPVAGGGGRVGRKQDRKEGTEGSKSLCAVPHPSSLVPDVSFEQVPLSAAISLRARMPQSSHVTGRDPRGLTGPRVGAGSQAELWQDSPEGACPTSQLAQPLVSGVLLQVSVRQPPNPVGTALCRAQPSKAGPGLHGPQLQPCPHRCLLTSSSQLQGKQGVNPSPAAACAMPLCPAQPDSV